MTKSVTMMCILILAERNLLKNSAPVLKYIPGFKNFNVGYLNADKLRSGGADYMKFACMLMHNGTFGWSGSYETQFFVDMKKLAAVYMNNSMFDGDSVANTAANFEYVKIYCLRKNRTVENGAVLRCFFVTETYSDMSMVTSQNAF